MSETQNPIQRGLALARTALNFASAAAAIAVVVVSSVIGLVFSAFHVPHSGRYLAVLFILTALVLFLLNSKKDEIAEILDKIDAVLTSRQRPNHPGPRVNRVGEQDFESGQIDNPTDGLGTSTFRTGRATVRGLFEKAADALLSPVQVGSVAVPAVLGGLSLLLFWTSHGTLGSIVLTLAVLALAVGQLTLCAIRSLVLHEFGRIADQVERGLTGDNRVRANETTSLI